MDRGLASDANRLAGSLWARQNRLLLLMESYGLFALWVVQAWRLTVA